MLDDGPRILDCLAFDDAYRISDVLADIGFLVMDVERLAGQTRPRPPSMVLRVHERAPPVVARSPLRRVPRPRPGQGRGAAMAAGRRVRRPTMPAGTTRRRVITCAEPGARCSGRGRPGNRQDHPRRCTQRRHRVADRRQRHTQEGSCVASITTTIESSSSRPLWRCRHRGHVSASHRPRLDLARGGRIRHPRRYLGASGSSRAGEAAAHRQGAQFVEIECSLDPRTRQGANPSATTIGYGCL